MFYFLSWGVLKTMGCNTKIVDFSMIWGYPHDLGPPQRKIFSNDINHLHQLRYCMRASAARFPAPPIFSY